MVNLWQQYDLRFNNQGHGLGIDFKGHIFYSWKDFRGSWLNFELPQCGAYPLRMKLMGKKL